MSGYAVAIAFSIEELQTILNGMEYAFNQLNTDMSLDESEREELARRQSAITRLSAILKEEQALS